MILVLYAELRECGACYAEVVKHTYLACDRAVLSRTAFEQLADLIICMFSRLGMCVRLFGYVCVYVLTFVCVYVFVYVCTYLCMCVRICVCVYAFVYVRTQVCAFDCKHADMSIMCTCRRVLRMCVRHEPPQR